MEGISYELGMTQPISRRIIAPGDCLLSFGIPTSRDEFFEALHNPGSRDFVINHCPVWQRYYTEIVSHLERVEPAIKTLGGRIVHNLTLAEFGRLLSEESPPVVIVFSHWADESVEFADGLFGVPEIISQIPEDYSGILDLGICTPERLALEVQSSREECLVRFSNTEATPYYWLYFYLVVFKILSESRVTYLQAVESAVYAFLARSTTRSERTEVTDAKTNIGFRGIFGGSRCAGTSRVGRAEKRTNNRKK